MRQLRYIGFLLVVAGLAALWVISGLDAPSTPESVTERSTDAPEHDSPPAPSIIPNQAMEELTDEQIAMLSDPSVLRFSQRLDFEDELQSYFDGYEQLPRQERREQAAAIRERLDEYARERRVSLQEQLLVEIALIQVNTDDQARQREQINELIDRYRDQSEARRHAWQEQPRPEFEAYKDQEARIVREVMARDDFPDDTRRQQYLEERLKEARIEAYGSGE